MNTYESLLQEAYDDQVEIIDYAFKSNRIKGLYCDNTIAINKNIKTIAEKTAVLAEELSHHNVSYDNIIELNDVNNVKQELRARSLAYDKLIGLHGIIDCYEAGCRNIYMMSEHLDLPVEYLNEAIEHYRKRYGIYGKLNNYIIYFEPSLCVIKMI